MVSKEMLRDLRKSKGLTGQQVADELGISYKVYQTYESGARNAGLPVVEKLADFYGVTTDYLLGRKAPDNPLLTMGDDAFIKAYREMPEYAKIIFADAMRKLSQAAAGETEQGSIMLTKTLGQLEDEAKEKSAENKDGGKFA